MAVVVILYLFYICGLTTNGYLFFRFCNSSASPASKSFNNIALFQLFLNTCNIITHAVVELSNELYTWRVLSTCFSFLSSYFLAALVVSIAGGRPLQQRLNSKLTITIFILLFVALFALFGRKYELCASDNCFSLNLANTKDDVAISLCAIVHFYFPSLTIVVASWSYGFRKYNEQTTEKHTPNSALTTFARFGSSSGTAVSVFIVYGMLVLNGIMYFNKSNEITRPNRICQFSCLNEDLYLLLSMFPIYMGHFMKKHEGKLPQQLET